MQEPEHATRTGTAERLNDDQTMKIIKFSSKTNIINNF